MNLDQRLKQLETIFTQELDTLKEDMRIQLKQLEDDFKYIDLRLSTIEEAIIHLNGSEQDV